MNHSLFYSIGVNIIIIYSLLMRTVYYSLVVLKQSKLKIDTSFWNFSLIIDEALLDSIISLLSISSVAIKRKGKLKLSAGFVFFKFLEIRDLIE